MIDTLDIAQLHKQARIALARTNFLEFVKYTMPEYQVNWHHIVMCRYLQLFAEGKIKKLMFFLPPRHGKLLPSNTPVLTTKGWKLHGELNVGDYVFGQDGLPKKVLANSGIYKWDVNEITFNDGKKILAANEHLWKLMVEYDDHKGRREVIMETQEIFKKRHRRRPYIQVSKPLELPKKELPIDPYVLGCWLGDGHSRQGVLAVGKLDIKHFSKLGEAREIRPNNYRVLISGLTTLLRENNLLKNKHIPMDYLLASREQRLELLRGLMDTDGTVDYRGNAEFTQKSGKLSHDVYTLLRTLGVKARFKTYDAKINNKIVGKKDRILFTVDSKDKFFKLKRKLSKSNNKALAESDRKYRLYIKTIEKYGNVDGNCIEVEGGMYLAGYDLIPTHNSELTSRRLPAYLFGINPNIKVIGCSYNATLARDFNRDVQRIIDDPLYQDVFPETKLNSKNVATDSKGAFKRNSDEFQVVNHKGYYRGVGVMGPLTGYDMDVGIIDDPVKDAVDASSPVQRAAKWEWYTKVFSSRIENHTQQLVTQTRWHQDDLSGRILKRINKKGDWVIVNLPAIKRGATMKEDPRKIGEPLWPEKKSLEQLLEYEEMDERGFHALYQQDPKPFKGGLVYPNWNMISDDEYHQLNVEEFYGLDFGFTNPAALVGCKIIGNRLYIDLKFYKTKLLSNMMGEEFERCGVSRYAPITADSADPGSIEDLFTLDYNIHPVEKFPGSILYGIKEVLKYDLYITESSQAIIRKESDCAEDEKTGEINTYQWKEDKEGNPLEDPIKKNDHAMDAIRYAVMGRERESESIVAMPIMGG